MTRHLPLRTRSSKVKTAHCTLVLDPPPTFTVDGQQVFDIRLMKIARTYALRPNGTASELVPDERDQALAERDAEILQTLQIDLLNPYDSDESRLMEFDAQEDPGDDEVAELMLQFAVQSADPLQYLDALRDPGTPKFHPRQFAITHTVALTETIWHSADPQAPYTYDPALNRHEVEHHTCQQLQIDLTTQKIDEPGAIPVCTRIVVFGYDPEESGEEPLFEFRISESNADFKYLWACVPDAKSVLARIGALAAQRRRSEEAEFGA